MRSWLLPLLVLAACAPVQLQGLPRETPSGALVFSTPEGYKVDVDFLPGMPPATVGKEPFDILFDLINTGPKPLPEGTTITLTGIDPLAFGIKRQPTWTLDKQLANGHARSFRVKGLKVREGYYGDSGVWVGARICLTYDEHRPEYCILKRKRFFVRV